VKAKPVEGVDPEAPVALGAARIVRTRLAELHSFDPAVRDPGAVVALHDMRIAAKRLRYLLELTGHLFGEAGDVAESEAKGLQEVLGDIHDCDMLTPRIDEVVASLRAQDGDALAILAQGEPDAIPAHVRDAPNAIAYRGLETLEAAIRGRRSLLYGRFIEHWDELARAGFRERLESALDEVEARARELDQTTETAGSEPVSE
jgi:hypothetical protein